MATVMEQVDELLASMGNPLEDNKEDKNVTGIIYGDSGGGKTITALRLARMLARLNGGKVLHLDAVNAWRSVKNHDDLIEAFNNGEIIRAKYKGKSQIDTLVTALEAAQSPTTKVPQFREFKVIVLDEASAMTDMDGDIVLKAGAAADDKKDPDILTLPDMGKTTERMRRTMIDLLRVENISVIFVAHTRQDEDKQVGYKVTRPRFMPKFSGTLREGLDFCVHMSAAEGVRTNDSIQYVRQVQTQPTKTVVAKSRVGGLALYETPDRFIEGVEKWILGGKVKSQVNVVVDDTLPDVAKSDSLSEDFSDALVQ